MTRLRLLKVVVQPVFVVDDGTSLAEVRPAPVDVTPDEWPEFATGRFLEATEELRRRVEEASGNSGVVTDP